MKKLSIGLRYLLVPTLIITVLTALVCWVIGWNTLRLFGVGLFYAGGGTALLSYFVLMIANSGFGNDDVSQVGPQAPRPEFSRAQFAVLATLIGLALIGLGALIQSLNPAQP